MCQHITSLLHNSAEILIWYISMSVAPEPLVSWPGVWRVLVSIPCVILYLSGISDCCPVSHIIFPSPLTWNILPSNCWLPPALNFTVTIIPDLNFYVFGSIVFHKKYKTYFFGTRKLKSCSDNDLNYLNRLSHKNLFLLMNSAYAINNLCTHLEYIKLLA